MSEQDHKEIDELSGIETTGHEWDGIKELNNPLPRWWLWTFYATIIFSVGYMIYYPSIPLVETSTMGISGQTNRLELKNDMAAVNEARGEKFQQLEALSLQEIRDNDELFRFAQAGGSSLFKVYCTQCHGSGAQGGPGYPNLNDDDWIWGGSLEAIYTSINHGIRNDEDDDARFGEMPAFGRDELLESADIQAVTQYVRQLSGQEHEAELATTGATVFEENCASCHGEAGLGDIEQGAPNLADSLWLYGGSTEEIAQQIWSPRHGVMPPWAARLGEANVKQLTIYVHSLGGGEADEVAQVTQ